MNVFKKAMTSVAVASLAIVPVAAHAADASKLSVAQNVRASKSTNGEKLAGGGFIVAALAAAAVIVGIVIVADNDDDADSN